MRAWRIISLTKAAGRNLLPECAFRSKTLRNASSLQSSRQTSFLYTSGSIKEHAKELYSPNKHCALPSGLYTSARVGEFPVPGYSYQFYHWHFTNMSRMYTTDKGTSEDIATAKARVKKFESEEGRRPRMLVCTLGKERDHGRGYKKVAAVFSDMGYDIDIGPPFREPANVAQSAIDADVHAIGMSTVANRHNKDIPKLITELELLGRKDILVVCGGQIPRQDYQQLLDAGVVDIYESSTNLPKAAMELTDMIEHSCKAKKHSVDEDKTRIRVGRECVKEFTRHSGRMPSILVASVGVDVSGLDYSDQMADIFTDFGFDVHLRPGTSTPLQVAQQAVDANVHAIAISTNDVDDNHKLLPQKLIEELKDCDRSDIVVSMCLRNIPPSHVSGLLEKGVAVIFGPDNIVQAAEKLFDLTELAYYLGSRNEQLYNTYALRAKLKNFKDRLGVDPHVLVTTVGEKSHSDVYEIIAMEFFQYGFIVTPGEKFYTPVQVAQRAVDAKVSAVVINTVPSTYKRLVPKVVEELKNLGRDDISVVCLGLVPKEHHQYLIDSKVAGIYERGKIHRAATDLIIAIEQNLKSK